MDSRPLKLLAAVTAIAALLFGYLAWVTSRAENANQQALPTGSAEPANWPRVVVAASAIEKGAAVRPEQLKLVAMQSAPAESYTRVEEVVGNAPAVAIAAGALLTRGQFAGGGALAHELGKEERAVAVQVNEVIGVGGLLQPGDFVDVVAYVTADGRQVINSQARVILERTRVLAYGNSGAARTGANTAVLAVPATDVPKLVLAANAGTLRLALHGATGTGDARLSRVAELREFEGARPAARAAGGTLIVRGGAQVSREVQ